MGDSVRLRSFPMPPSDNALKRIVPVKGKMRMAKTPVYRDYEFEVKIWTMKNREDLDKARDFTLKLGPGWALKVDRVFWFQRESIVMKNDSAKGIAKAGEPKQNDTFNRVKALHDVLAATLGVDDKWFWEGDTKKKILKYVAFPECVDIKLSLADMFQE